MENAEVVKKCRETIPKRGEFSSRVIPGKGSRWPSNTKDYFEWSERQTAPSHRVLAMRRGGKGAFPEFGCFAGKRFQTLWLGKGIPRRNASNSSVEQILKLAIKDSLQKIAEAKYETEVRDLLTKRSRLGANQSFHGKSKQLVCLVHLGRKVVMAIDRDLGQVCKISLLRPQDILALWS